MKKLTSKYTIDDIVDLSYSSAEQVVDEIKTAWERYGKENVRYDVDIEYGYGDSQSARARLMCRRNMNANEEKKEIERLRLQKQQADEWKRKQYEALKKEFENENR